MLVICLFEVILLHSHVALSVRAQVFDDNKPVLFYLQRPQWVHFLCRKSLRSTLPWSTSLLCIAG